jgi:hypothetical protein
MFRVFAVVCALVGVTHHASSQMITTNFIGPYDLSNWTSDVSGSASVFSSSPLSVVLGGQSSGPSELYEIPSTISLTITAVGTGPWSFDWQYTSHVDPPTSPKGSGYLLNGNFIQLAGGDVQTSGSFSTNVSHGDVIGFRNFTTFGGGSSTNVAGITVSNFSAPVPEPSTYALLLMTGAGALLWTRRRR